MSDNILTAEMIDRELAALAEEHQRGRSRWTPELDAILIKAHEDHPSLPWYKLGDWWQARYGWGGYKALIIRYKKLKAAQNG